MKILLVYPEFPDTFWSFKHAPKFIRKKAGAPPLGLLTVAAMLPLEWKKRLVDLNVAHLTEEDLAWADYVFISAVVVQRESVRAILKRCTMAGVKVVASGPLFTMEYQQFPDVDHFVLSEAEETLAPFLRDQEQDQARRVYASDEFPLSTKRLSLFGSWRISTIPTRSVFSSRAAVRSIVAFAV